MTLIGILRNNPTAGYFVWHYNYHRWHPDDVWVISEEKCLGWDNENLRWWNEV